MERSLVILAAGMASRYGGPKQLAPVGPSMEALLEYSIYDGLRAGFGRVVLVVRAETEAEFRRRFDDRLDPALASRGVELRYVHQDSDALPGGFERPAARTKPWGTAHALLAAAPALDGPFAVLNADDFYGARAFRALADFFADRESDAGNRAAVVGFEVGETLSESGPVSRARCTVAGDGEGEGWGGELRDIVELPRVWRSENGVVYSDPSDDGGGERPLDASAPVSMNLWGFGPDFLDELRPRFRAFLESSIDDPKAEFLLPDVVRALVRERRLRVRLLRGRGPWCGLTHADDREKVSALLAEWVRDGDYPANLWAASAHGHR